MIRLKCPKCQQILSLDDSQAGEVVACSACQAKLRVPERKPAAGPSPAPAPPAAPAAPAAPRPSRVPAGEADDEDVPVVAAAGDDDEDDAADADDRSGKGKGRFAVRPFKPDGGFSPLGLVLLPLFTVLAALLLGALASFIGQWLYLIVLFPLVIGFGVGMAGLAAVRMGKVRNIALAGLVGLAAGFTAMLTYHFCDYLRLRASVASLPPDVVRQLNDPAAGFRAGARPLPPGVAAEVRQALQVTSFPAYLHHAATEGVSIGRSGSGLNLGYYGTWIYWIVEVGIVAVISLLCCVGAAGSPFCRPCSAWKKEDKLGHLDMDPDEAKEAVEKGRLEQLKPSDDLTGLRLKAHVCPNCRKDSDVELTLETVQRQGKDQEKTSDLVQVTASGAALGYLRRRFQEVEDEAERERQRDRRKHRDEDDEDAG